MKCVFLLLKDICRITSKYVVCKMFEPSVYLKVRVTEILVTLRASILVSRFMNYDVHVSNRGLKTTMTDQA